MRSKKVPEMIGHEFKAAFFPTWETPAKNNMFFFPKVYNMLWSVLLNIQGEKQIEAHWICLFFLDVFLLATFY